MASEKRLSSTNETKRITGTVFSRRPEIDDVTHVVMDQFMTAGDRVVVEIVGCELSDFATTLNAKKGLTNQPKPLGK